MADLHVIHITAIIELRITQKEFVLPTFYLSSNMPFSKTIYYYEIKNTTRHNENFISDLWESLTPLN